jgi:hypothetical protein
VKDFWNELLESIRKQVVLFYIWVALIVVNLSLHGVAFSTNFELAEGAGRYFFTAALALHVCGALFIVRLIQGLPENSGLGFFRPIASNLARGRKLLIAVAIFLLAAALPLSPDYIYMRASAGAIWATIQAQLSLFALPFLFCLWLATVTRNLTWFLGGAIITGTLARFLFFVWEISDDPAYPTDPVPAEQHLAFWICVVGLSAATTWRYLHSLLGSRIIGVVALVTAFFIGLVWPYTYPVARPYPYPSRTAVDLKLLPSYFGSVTWQQSDYANAPWVACAELGDVFGSDERIPTIQYIQAKFVLSDGEEYKLMTPQNPEYFERTTAKVLSSRFKKLGLVANPTNLAPYNFSIQLFGVNRTLPNKFKGQTGKLVLDISGRMVQLTKRGEMPTSTNGHLSFANGIVVLRSKENINWRCFSYQRTTAHEAQCGETYFLYVLNEASHHNALMSASAATNGAWISEPWYLACTSDSEYPGIYSGDVSLSFSQKLEGITLSIFEAQKQEPFHTTVVIPAFTIPNQRFE